MQTNRMLLVGALGVMLGALPTRTADAQDPVPTHRTGARPAAEVFYSQLRVDGDGRSLPADGVGAKLMWNAVPAVPTLTGMIGRADVGLYASYTPARSLGTGARYSTFGIGAQTEVRPFTAPLVGRLDPFLSLGAGVLRTNVDANGAPRKSAPSPLLTASQTAFTLVPGVGARVLLTPNLALLGDVRDLISYRRDTRHNVALGAGLRFGF